MTAARPGHVAAAALLPPLGVYLAHGPGRDFWIASGLTVAGFLPGAAFALWSVLRCEAVPVRAPAVPAAG